MMRKIVAASALAILSTLAVSGNCSQKCPERDKMSADQKLEALKKPLERGDQIAVVCAVAFMEDLSHAGDRRAMQIIAQNLDLPRPGSPADLEWQLPSGPQSYGGGYPAMDDMTYFRKDAVPVLLDTIAQASPGSLLSQNAVRVFMTIEASDPPSGVKLLVQEAGKREGNSADVLMEAAKYAVSVGQCRYAVQACHDALKTGQ